MFRNRGEVPNINIGQEDNKSSGYSAPHYSNYWNGRFIIVNYDKSFVAISLITTFIILVTGFCAYLFAYKLPFEDPIANVKNNFLTAQLIFLLVPIILTILAVFLTKSNKENLIKYLRIIAILSLISILILWGVKFNLDNKYNNENVFASYYDEYEGKNNDEDSKRITIGLSGINVSSPKQAYITKNKDAYTNFTIKTIIYIFLQFLAVIFILYFSFRIEHIEEKKGKLKKEDEVLFDEKQNVKF